MDTNLMGFFYSISSRIDYSTSIAASHKQPFSFIIFYSKFYLDIFIRFPT